MPVANDFILFKCWRHHVALESELHREFASKHVRGEWFDLDDGDLYEIGAYFFDSPQWSNGKTPYEEYEISYANYQRENAEWPEVVT